MIRWLSMSAMVMVVTAVVGAAEEGSGSSEERGYRIEQPGTITFTTGVQIRGKVEKPQVMILLPKEKPIYRELSLSHSFKADIIEPLPFSPITR